MLNLYYGIFSNITFSIFHVAVCVPPYTQAALLRYNTFKILYNVLFMIYTHWTTIMFEDIIKVLAVRFLFLTGFCSNKKDLVSLMRSVLSLSDQQGQFLCLDNYLILIDYDYEI